MKTFLKAHWVLLSALAAGTILLFILLRGCGKDPFLTANKTTETEIVKNLKDSLSILRVEKDSIARGKYESDLQIIALQAGYDSIQRELLASVEVIHENAGDISKTLAAGDRVRIIHDTPMIVSNCDTLAEQVRHITPLLANHERIEDSLIRSHIVIMQARDQDDSMQALIVVNLNAQTRLSTKALDSLQTNYNSLFADDSKKTIELKLLKPVAIGGGIAIAILAAALLIKK